MFIHSTLISLRDTDATGVLYFTEQFRIALEAFESYLKASGLSLGKLLETADFLLPIVHAEGDYLAPLVVGDEVEIHLKVLKMGTSSFTLHYILNSSDKKHKVGVATIVHVTISRKTKKSIPIPEPLLSLLKKLL
jgi:1,4-dihydroxy-2-naphthoyl-CoA hydrolase